MRIKPAVVNALLPEFVRNVVVPGIAFSGLALIVRAMLDSASPIQAVLEVRAFLGFWALHAVVWSLLLVPFAWALLILSRTTYIFDRYAVTKEFSFLVLRKKTVPYDKIVHLDLNISIWDRISGAGDITLKTAEDNEPDLTLRYVPQPEKVERWIMGKIR